MNLNININNDNNENLNPDLILNPIDNEKNKPIIIDQTNEKDFNFHFTSTKNKN